MDGETRNQGLTRWPRALPEEGSRRCGALDCISGAFEDGEDVIGHGLDRRSAVSFDGLPNEFAVVRRDLGGHIVAKLPKPCEKSSMSLPSNVPIRP